MDPLLSMNEAFIVKLNGILEENYQNEKFGVKELATAAGISRSNLHRKLHQIKGLSASEFIMSYRLQKAYVLLEKEVSTVSEIAYAVGFSSPSYFSQCFHKQYNYAPVDVKNRNEEKSLLDASKSDSLLEKGLTNKKVEIGKLKVYTITILVLLLIITGVVLSLNEKKGMDSPQIRSIAVLPLQAKSNLINNEILSEAMQTGLISSLGKINGIKIISRETTLKYQDSNKTMDNIIQELGVDFLVSGEINYSDQDSLVLQLSMYHLGTTTSDIKQFTYNNSIENIISVQNEASINIGISTGVIINPQLEFVGHNNRIVNKDAYKNYIRGMFYLHKSTQEDFDKGIQFLYKALDDDPAEPLVYAGLAYGYVILGHSSSENRNVFGMAKVAALKAIELDSTQLEAYAALASIDIYHDRNWEEAEEIFDFLLSKNPSMANVHYDKAWYCMLIGDKENALKHHDLAEKLDPFNIKYIAWSAWLYAYYGYYDIAMEKVEMALTVAPEHSISHFAKGFTYQQQNNTAMAMESYNKAYQLNPKMVGLLGALYAEMGEIKRTNELIEEVRDWPKSPWKNWILAQLYASIKDTKSAVKMLNTEPKHAFVAWAPISPAFDGIKEDEEFKNFVSTLNIPFKKEHIAGNFED